MMLRYIAGPLIGSIIGYFTNFIAVKMLFYPRNEIHLFGHRLPLTPGAIPKGKSRLARAIGSAVGEQLLTGDDIQAKLMQPDVTDAIAERILHEADGNIVQIGEKFVGKELDMQAVRSTVADAITNEIFLSVQKLPVSDLIIEKGASAIKQQFAGTMLAMFLNDDMIQSVAGPVGAEIENYIQENGRPFIEQEVTERFDALMELPVSNLLEKMQPDREKRKAVIVAVYNSLVQQGISKMLKELNIAGMVEDKINAMDIDELEQLVMTVMKKELNTIVNLGALIGFVLGLINLLF